MTAMTATPTHRPPWPGLPRGPVTRDVLDSMPDDGHRYELIDGILIVSPAPRMVHQRAVVSLVVLLDATCPDDFEVFTAPFDVALADDTVMQPDVLVCRVSDLTERDLPAAPVLAVEVLSPSTRGIDLLLKKDRLQRAGCQHYWVVDPDVPALTAWTLTDGVYTEAASVTGDERLVVSDPYDLELTPNGLVAR